jgi:hypothetical protein
MHRSVLLPILPAILLLCTFAAGQPVERPQFVGVRVGFGHCYKAGVWTPVEVTLRGGSEPLVGRVVLSTEDSDGAMARVAGPENSCQVVPGQDTSLVLYVRFGRLYSSLSAEFLVDGRRVAAKTFETAEAVDADHFRDAIQSPWLIVHVGRGSAGFEDAAALHSTSEHGQPAVAQVRDARELPTQWYGYEGVDALVLCTGRPEVLRTLTKGSARLQALDEWVRMGGKLILCVGREGDQVLQPDMPLARFAPGRFDRTLSLAQTAPLETYAGATTPIKTAPQEAVRVARLTHVKGKVEAGDADDLPLVVRTAHGLGQVLFVAADLDLAPLKDWDGQKLLAAKLLELPAAEPVKEDQFAVYREFRDVSGQLRSALDQFTGVRVVPFALVALLVIGYILLIGPGDYFFLRKVLRRMELTWVTFPLIVLGVSAGAWWLATWLKGDQLRLNQVDLVDVDVASGGVRGTSWMNIFSPRMETYDLSLHGRLPDGQAADDAHSTVAWLGVTGEGLGGMRRGRGGSGAGMSLGGGQYAFSPALDKMLGVPIQVWSTKSFTSRWWAASPQAPLKSDLGDADRQLVGTITNTLGVPLSFCRVVYGSRSNDYWVYSLGEMAPGQTVEIGTTTRRLDLNSMVHKRKFFGGEDEFVSPQQGPARFRSADADLRQVLQTMMFYEAAGGRAPSNLTNDYQRFVDLSGALKAGRAVLVAWPPKDSDRHGADLLRGDDPMNGPLDKHFTAYRFVLPVGKKDRS